MSDFPIDFVVTWVDGSDPEWIEKKIDTLKIMLQIMKPRLFSRYYEVAFFNEGR